MAQTLYFISDRIYVEGHKLGSYDLNYEEMEKRKKFDDPIDKSSPHTLYKRRKSIIAFRTRHESIFNAQRTYNTNIFTDYKLYKVATNSFHKAPYSLLNLLYKVNRKKKTYQSIASEYWKPTLTWECHEYLCEYAWIVSVHTIHMDHDELDAVNFTHVRDVTFAEKHFCTQ